MSTDAQPDYVIKARLDIVEGSNAGGDIAGRRLRGIEGEARRVGTSISGFLTSAFATLGGAAGIGFAIRGIIRLNSEIQTTRNGLATLFNAMTGMPIASTISIARRELRLLQIDAAKGVGELSDYTQAYQMILSPSLGAGKSLDAIRGLVRNSLAAGAAMRGNEGLRLMPMDLVQAMSGQVGLRTTPMIAQALAAAGITLETFRKADAPKQFDLLNKAFERFGPGVALMGKSWDAQFSTLRDNTKQFIRDWTSPIFGVWTKGLIGINEWMTKNQTLIATTTTEWGGKMVALWDRLISQASAYAAIVGAASLAPMVAPGVMALRAGGARVGAGLGAVAGGYAWGSTLPGRVGLFGAQGRISSGLAGAFGEINAGASAMLGTTLSALAGPLSVAAVALGGVFTAIKNGGPGIAFAKSAFAGLVTALESLGIAFGVLTVQGGSLDAVGQSLAGSFGALATAAAPVVRIFSSMVTVMSSIADAYRAVMGAIYGSPDITPDGVIGRVGDAGAASRGIADRATDALAAIWYPNSRGRTFAATPPPGGAKLPTGRVPPPPNINIGNVTLMVKTEMNADPARVMGALKEGLRDLSLYTRQSRRQPTLAGY